MICTGNTRNEGHYFRKDNNSGKGKEAGSASLVSRIIRDLVSGTYLLSD